MFDKKKLNFWRLAIPFIGMTIIILFLLWSSPLKSKSAMMNSSMGSMMKSMHGSNLNIYGLLKSQNTQQQINNTAEHHKNSPAKNIGVLTSIIVFLLLPFLIGGSIILAIIWIK